MKVNLIGDGIVRYIEKELKDTEQRLIETEGKDVTAIKNIMNMVKTLTDSMKKSRAEKSIEDDEKCGRLKAIFWSFGNIACTDTSIVMRKIEDRDQNDIMQTRWEYAVMKSSVDFEMGWNEYKSNTSLTAAIIKDSEFIGYCGINDISQNPWEIAIELFPEWTHRGIGSIVIPAMLNAIKERLGVTAFKVRIDPANVASQRLFEKLGAIPSGIGNYIIYDEEAINRCEEFNLELIDDALIAKAKEFNVEPRKLLSHVLEYTLTWH